MSVLAIIQARLGSSRLPQKSLMDIGGRNLIQRVVERVRQIRGVDHVVLAVPHGELGALCYCAHTIAPEVPENHVLARFVAVAQLYPDADTIMRITGDCPLLDPRVAEDVLALYRESHGWYAWNVSPGYCDGEDVEVFKRDALMRASAQAFHDDDKEHVTSWIRRHYPIVTLRAANPGRRKTSVDTLQDLEYVRSLYASTTATV